MVQKHSNNSNNINKTKKRSPTKWKPQPVGYLSSKSKQDNFGQRKAAGHSPFPCVPLPFNSTPCFEGKVSPKRLQRFAGCIYLYHGKCWFFCLLCFVFLYFVMGHTQLCSIVIPSGNWGTICWPRDPNHPYYMQSLSCCLENTGSWPILQIWQFSFSPQKFPAFRVPWEHLSYSPE